MSDKIKSHGERGRLRIGDDWNAITIIATSQTNPLKAVAEFVENSIDAGAAHVSIIRGREHKQHYLKIVDDGGGIPCSEDGRPDFKYVATHICDSLKRRLKEQGIQGVQGEFGIGLLSFWTVGHKLTMVSAGKDNKTYQMIMEKGRPGYTINPRGHLIPFKGTQLLIAPLLEGMRALNGEKIHRYLASELRDRIKASGVKIKVVDRSSRFECTVEPRKYSGQLLHNIPQAGTAFGDVYFELYLNEKNAGNCVSLFRSGTRVLPNICALDEFNVLPWTSGYFEGIVDAPFLHLTPGTRDGIIRDEKYAEFCRALTAVQERLAAVAAEQEKAEDERSSKKILHSVQKALREAVLALPPEDYDWFDLHKNAGKRGPLDGHAGADVPADQDGREVPPANGGQKEFFEFAGPLFSARIHPASALVEVGAQRNLRAMAYDRRRRQIDENIGVEWLIAEGQGSLDKVSGEIVVFQAPLEPGLCRLKARVRQGEIACEAEALITIVDALIKPADIPGDSFSKGLPGYTLESAPGKAWRARYDKERNIIVINSGHRDFLYAGADRMRKLRYICRLFAKELILLNFVGSPPEQLLERLVELSLYTEENLK